MSVDVVRKSDTQLIWYIRQTPELEKLWDKIHEKAGSEGQRKVLVLADGSTEMLETAMEDVLDVQ